MPPNTDLAATRRYHEGTKHSEERLRTSRHSLDWDNQPIPYKIYTSLEPIPLPRELPPSEMPALDAIANIGPAPPGDVIPDLETVARLCLYSNGITRWLRRGGGEMPFRAAACTGALYHIELYLVSGDIPGLPAGVYHYGAHDHALRQLRAGDFRGALVEATGQEPSVAQAPLIVVSTSTFWRNAWKYEARAYRHSYWDSGTVLANLLAVAEARELPARVVLGWADGPVNRLLDVDPDREAAVALVPLGRSQDVPLQAPPVQPLGLPVLPLSACERVYPEILEMHAAPRSAPGRRLRRGRGATWTRGSRDSPASPSNSGQSPRRRSRETL